MLKFNILFILFLILFSGCKKKEPKQKAHSNTIEFQHTVKPYKAISPLISDLLNQNKNASFQDFINKINFTHLFKSPLIEVDSLDDEMVFLNFLYKDFRKNIKVEFEVFGIYADYCFGDKKLINIENSDLWYRTYKVPKDICFSYRFLITEGNKKTYVSDPQNPKRIPTGDIKHYTYSVVDLTNSKLENYNKQNINVDNGVLKKINFKSTILDNRRNVHIYLPPKYDSIRSKPYPVIYLFDGFLYRERIETSNILNNLISENKIDPIVAIMISRSSKKERHIELALYPNHTKFFIDELLLYFEEKYNLSKVPSERIIGGISYGGLTATYLAFMNPELFGKVISQSGSFWRSNEVLLDGSIPNVRTDYLIEKFIKSPKKELKLYLDWGLQEYWVLASNRRFIKVLEKKQYNYRFHEFNGWHDWANSRKSFVTGIQYLMND